MSMPDASVRADAGCEWVPLDQPVYLAYHDEEWGVPVHDDARLFEMLSLEGAQAGLSWSTILNKRDGYRSAFAGFDPAKVARFTPAKVERLLQDPGIVRNRLKVESTVNNAARVREVQRELGSLDAYLWAFVGGHPLVGRWKSIRDSRGDRGVDGDEQGPEAPRVPVRRAHRLLCLHAGVRARERP
jgi:DNA-3-methyladenine glycosylase I